MIGTVLRVVTTSFENIILIDDHPDITGKSLIGILAHETARSSLLQKTGSNLYLKNTDTVTQGFTRPG